LSGSFFSYAVISASVNGYVLLLASGLKRVLFLVAQLCEIFVDSLYGGSDDTMSLADLGNDFD
jgi:hypothetical protein